MWNLLFTPILSGAVAVLVATLAIRLDATKSANSELIKKRISLYDTLVPKLNDIYCFFHVVGPWKKLEPPMVIERKRELDHCIYVFGPLFSPKVKEEYNIFCDLCFDTYNSLGGDAKLRARHKYLRDNWGAAWNTNWDMLFVDAARSANISDVGKSYDALVAALAAEIGAGPKLPNRYLLKLKHHTTKVIIPAVASLRFSKKITDQSSRSAEPDNIRNHLKL